MTDTPTQEQVTQEQIAKFRKAIAEYDVLKEIEKGVAPVVAEACLTGMKSQLKSLEDELAQFERPAEQDVVERIARTYFNLGSDEMIGQCRQNTQDWLDAITRAGLTVEQGWQPIETAEKPKRLGPPALLVRPKSPLGVCNQLVIARWCGLSAQGHTVEAWCWPDEPSDIFDDDAFMRFVDAGKTFECTRFYAWRSILPLPTPPQEDQDQ